MTRVDLYDSILEGAVERVRPKMMTVAAIVTTAEGKTRAFWERNLRFMTYSSKDGPQGGAPAIMPAGMPGDRAAAIFSSPEEIGKFIDGKC